VINSHQNRLNRVAAMRLRQEIARRVVTGSSLLEIAAELDVSANTVRTQLLDLLRQGHRDDGQPWKSRVQFRKTSIS